MAANHWFLRAILPAKWYGAVKTGTRLWLIECSSGHKRDLWDAGGVRYKAFGEPRTYGRCRECGKASCLKIRKKTGAEKTEIAGEAP